MSRMSTALVATVLALVLAACSVTAVSSDDASNDVPSVALDQDDAPAPHSGISDVIEEVLPSVVSVRVTSLTQDAAGDLQEGRGEGSGVVIDKEGIIVTNNHVVEQATEVTIVFNDGEKLSGDVLGTNPERDLAVIRVGADDLDPITLGSSEQLRLGDDAIAIGFPLGLGGATVTQGIISATDRTIAVGNATTGGSSRLQNVLQTDAAINPGNSGGALVDSIGRLIGINTAAAQAGAAENIGFAISVDGAIPVIDEILTKPAEERAWLGVFLAGVESDAEAAQLELDEEVRGALIVEVIPGSPAEEAGLAEGEVITSIEGEPIGSDRDLVESLIDHSPGDSVELDLVSNEGSRSETIELAPRPVTFGQPQD